MQLYEILNVLKNATYDEIKASYKKLAQSNHPDKGGDEETFKKIKNAYEILIDPERRKQYDTIGTMNDKRDPREEALNELVKCLQCILYGINFYSDDIISCMRTSICNRRSQLSNDLTNVSNVLNGIIHVSQKIKYKSNVDINVIDSYLREQINCKKNDISDITRQIQVMDLMLEILENYEFLQN